MSLFDMFYRDSVTSPNQRVSSSATADEFDNLGTRVSAWALVQHNEDGTHNIKPSGFDFVPIGGIIVWPGSSAPSGWLICDGSQVSRSTYGSLFNVISTTYGAGDGSTTYNLPDLRQRFPLGKAAAGTGSVLGSTGGAIDHTHSVPSLSTSASGSTSSDGAHTHTGLTGATAPGTDSQGSHSHGGATGSVDLSHTHTYSFTTGFPSLVVAVQAGSADTIVADTGHTHDGSGTTSGASVSMVHSHSISTDGSHSHTVNSHTHSISSDGLHNHSVSVTGSTGTGTTGTNNPPYLVINYIICAGV